MVLPQIKRVRKGILFFTLLASSFAPLMAQPAKDVKWLHKIYARETPVFKAWMQAADRSSYPLFLLIPAGAVTAGAAGFGTYTLEQGFEVAGAAVGSYLLMEGTKRTVKRLRPYQTEGLADIVYYRGTTEAPESDSYSFPSGHATLAFVSATSLSLQHPKWYVIVPAYAWASGVALSRVWNGVHYPSDVAVGAVLGTGVAILAHRLAPKLLNRQGVSTSLEVRPLVLSFQKNF